MFRIKTLVVQRRRTPLMLLAVGLVAVCVGCEGQSEPVQIQIPSDGKQLQNPPGQSVSETTEQVRQRFINANTREEAVTAQKVWIADLKRRYGGTIDASVFGPDAIAHDVRFSKLMREWNPLHCTADDLKSIAGKPARETKDSIEYTFDNGYDGSTYRFKISASTIHAVEYIPGE